MSLIIGGISIGGALAAGAATAVGTYAVGSLLSPSSPGGQSQSADTSGTAANAADPFAGQRAGYQTALGGFMASPNNVQSDPYGAVAATPQANSSAGAQMMSQMLTPGYQFNSTDPSYAWRMSQGAGALASSKAASGLLNSGNAATALVDYGQNQASTEYAAQFARASSQDGQSFGEQQQTFSDLMAGDSAYNTSVSNQFSRLAQLSGANIGNPGEAGQLQQNGTAAASAGLQSAVAPVTSALGKAVGGMFSSSPDAAGNPNGGTSVNPNNTDSMGNSLSMYGAGGAADGSVPYL